VRDPSRGTVPEFRIIGHVTKTASVKTHDPDVGVLLLSAIDASVTDPAPWGITFYPTLSGLKVVKVAGLIKALVRATRQ
jgi:hypothetical protein